MALAEVQQIMEILKSAQQRKLDQQKIDADNEQNKNTNEYRKALIDDAHKHLDEDKRQFDAQHALAIKAAEGVKATQDLAHLKTKSDLSQFILGGGVIPGDTTQAAGGGADNGFSPVGGASSPLATSVMHTIPMGEGSAPLQLQLPSQSIYDAQQKEQAQKQAGISTILDRPKVDAKIEEARTLQADMLKKQDEAKQADLYKIMAQRGEDAKIRKEAEDAQMARLQYSQQQENYRAGLKNQQDQTDLSPYIMMGQTGELTQEDINKLPLKAAEKMKITNGVIAPGGRILSSTSKQSLMDMSTISTAVPHLDYALKLLKDHPIAARTPGTDAYKQYQEALGQVELVLPQVGRIIAGDKGRMSNQQIKYAEGSFLPSRNPITADYQTNLKNRNDFVKTMDDVMNTHLTGMSEKHKAFLKDNFGIKPLGSFGSSGVPVTTQQAQPVQPQLSPQALKIMQELGIK